MAAHAEAAPRHGQASALAVEIASAGIAAGVVAGAGMALWAMILYGWRGLGFMTPIYAIAGTFYGREALQGGWGPGFWGFVLHFAIAAAVGVGYAVLAKRDTPPLESVAGGVIYAVVAWAILTYLVARVVDPTFLSTVSEAPFAWFGAHVVFGITLGLVPQLRLSAADAAARR